ncbi:hypothetical protein JW905_15425 [bacterium]|nr:hypothetical protein [candidate division CSSED10-310 bacterium]
MIESKHTVEMMRLRTELPFLDGDPQVIMETAVHPLGVIAALSILRFSRGDFYSNSR